MGGWVEGKMGKGWGDVDPNEQLTALLSFYGPFGLKALAFQVNAASPLMTYLTEVTGWLITACMEYCKSQ